MPLPIGPDYHMHVRTASDPALSPDGRRLAFTMRWFDQDTMKARSEIQLMDLPDGEPSAVTTQSDSEMPAWSWDGSSLAFLRPDEKKRRQVWIVPASGGEARQITSQRLGVDSFAWSPAANSIAYRADVDPNVPPEDHDPERDPLPRVARRIRYRQDGAGWRGDAFRHLFVVNCDTGISAQLTYGEADDGPPVWSPDGERIAFISDRSPFRDTTCRNEVYVIPVTGAQGDRWSGGLYMAGSIGWSPDGQRLVVVGAEQPEQVGGYGLSCQGWIYVLEPGTYPSRITDDSVRPLSTASGHPIGFDNPELRWTPEDDVLFVADAKGQSYLCSVPAEGGETRMVTPGGQQITGWTADTNGTTAITVAVPTENTGDLYSVDVASGTQERLTALNDSYFKEHPAATLEKFTVRRDDFDIECRVWLPPDFDPARRYPLLLDVHGGPHGVFYDAFYPIHQVAATNGYVVLAPNPRGSSSYGLEFATEVHGDWGGGDYLDVMAAVTEALKRPYVDESRVVLHGSSYGGYMASWAVGHTDRFRAAVIAAPVTNLPSFYGTSDIGVSFSEVQFGGRRSDNMSWYVRHSPLTYASNVSTPVLLLHGEDDQRVLIEQSEQYFVALMRSGKTVEFVRLPKTNHGIFRARHPKIRQEYFSRMLAWFERWLRDTEIIFGPPSNGHRPR
ncbi:MAG: S9 family peptidase [Dehalococcoidia bacterium]